MSARAWRMLAVEPNERPGLLRAFAYFFCLLASYAILRPVRSEMAAQIGVRALPGMMTAVFLLSLAVMPVFGWVTSRYPRRRMLPLVRLLDARGFLKREPGQWDLTNFCLRLSQARCRHLAETPASAGTLTAPLPSLRAGAATGR